MEKVFEVEVEEAVQCVAVSPTSQLLAVGTCEPTITLISQQTGQIQKSLTGHAGGTNNLKFLQFPMLVSVGEDGKLKLWDTEKGEIIKEIDCPGKDADKTIDGHTVQNLEVSGDKTYVTCSAGKSVHVLNISTMDITTYDDIAQNGIIEDLNFDSKGVLMAAFYGGVALWRPSEENAIVKIEYPGTNCYTNGQWIVGGTYENTIHIWHTAPNSQEMVELTARGYTGRVPKVRFHPVGRYLASYGGDTLLVWDFEGQGPAGSTPVHLPCGEEQITDFDWQSQEYGYVDNQLLCVGQKGGEVYVFSIEMSTKGLQGPVGVGTIPSGDEVTCVQWGAQGSLYAGYLSGNVRKWNVGDWQLRLKQMLEAQIRAQFQAYQQISQQQTQQQ
eukprot:TRINITY_DN24648_c0_g2_i2.p1 TRINITY_DN24648_c0_g2~~TRINITY_DN24648_c0_g2_i2.p1  ORF type:complete len:385 (+),score=43.19 TRINITY_DN24648_c0_g2_i2:107-1261(+)